MVADSLLVACGAFGVSAFCFAAGFVTGSANRGGSTTFPLTHVSFDPSASDLDRLKVLDEARAAVLDGRLSETHQLQDYRTADEARKPGGRFEN